MTIAPPDRVFDDPDTIVLVAGADERFALGLTVALTSALRALDRSRPAHVFVLDGGFEPGTAARCRSALAAARPDALIDVVRPDRRRLAHLLVKSSAFSRATYLRLLIPEFVPAHYRRALYLDSDVVVLGDVSHLWTLPGSDRTAFWAALDEGLRDQDYIRDTLRLPVRGAPYFNSGVMLIDLATWRRSGMSQRALAHLETRGHVGRFHDQDALNAVAVGEWRPLPQSWNFQVNGAKLRSSPDPSGRPPKIVHYLNGKPWVHPEPCACQAQFDAALRASGWYGPLGYAAWRVPRRLREALSALRRSPALAPVRDLARRVRAARSPAAPAARPSRPRG